MITSRRSLFGAGAGAAALAVTGGVQARSLQTSAADTPESDARALARLLGRDKLLWSPHVQPEGYRSLHKIFATRRIAKAARPSTLPRAERELQIAYRDGERDETLEDFLEREYVAGLLVLKGGRIMLERYRLGFTEEDHWTSMSVVKSMTSVLVGCALKDGIFPNLDVQLTRYMPEFTGSGYDGVSLRHLLMMTSGVRWNENYVDPRSDVNEHYEKVIADRTPGAIVAHLRTLERIHEPGSHFHYNTGDTYLIGCMLNRASGKYMADYFSERIWSRIGTEGDAYYMLDSDDGQEVAGSSANARLRDYGRFGLFCLADGVADGERILPEGWIAESTRPSAPGYSGTGGGYGYQWWVNEDGSYVARGFAGQLIYINPARQVVITLLSCLPFRAYAREDYTSSTRRGNFITAVIDALG